MLLLLDLLPHRTLSWLGRSTSINALELENAVFRHGMRLLPGQRRSLDLRRGDRAVLAAASRAIPRERWSLLFARPQTLLRWHRAWSGGSTSESGWGCCGSEAVSVLARLVRDQACREWKSPRPANPITNASDPGNEERIRTARLTR